MKHPIKYITIFVVVSAFLAVLHVVSSEERFVYNKQTGPSHLKYEKALIVEVVDETLSTDPKIPGLIKGTQDLNVEILTGDHKGEQHIVKNYLSARFNVIGIEGRTIVVCVDTAVPKRYKITVSSHHRSPVLYAAVALFALVLLLIGGKNGLRSLVGLSFTMASILLLFIPMLVQGYSPILSTVFIVVLTTIMTVLCITGWTIKSVAAIMGTTLGVIIAGLLSFFFGALAHVSGFQTGEAETLILISASTGMNVGQLLFAGLLIASLGAVMDVAVSISAGVHEVFITNPMLPRRKLYQSGMTIGRDIMGSMSNTLILAFAGTSLNSLILIYAYNVDSFRLVNLDDISIEILRGLCGSTAIVLTVPIVSLLSSWLFPIILQRKTNRSKEVAFSERTLD